MLTSCFVFRTLLTIIMSEVTSSIVKSIVKKDLTEFMGKIFLLFLLSFPGAFVNSSIDYLNKKLGLQFRENLTKNLQDSFLADMCYYKITNLDSRIRNPDQIFTADIEKFAFSISELFSNFSKPLLDIILFSKKLSDTLGFKGPALMIGWYLLSGVLIRYIAPPFGKLTAIEQSK